MPGGVVRGGHVAELGGELCRRESPVAEEGLDDTQPHRVQQQIRACHRSSLVRMLLSMVTFASM